MTRQVIVTATECDETLVFIELSRCHVSDEGNALAAIPIRAGLLRRNRWLLWTTPQPLQDYIIILERHDFPAVFGKSVDDRSHVESSLICAVGLFEFLLLIAKECHIAARCDDMGVFAPSPSSPCVFISTRLRLWIRS